MLFRSFKVIKLRDSSQMGEKVIVQGGTFLNESVLRAFELVSGREVIRPDKAGLMGAYGSAILSRNNYQGGESTLLKADELDGFSVSKTNSRCGKCGNNCLLTISKFNDGREYVTGNRCEKGAGEEEKKTDLPPNLFASKYKRLFSHYKPLDETHAKRDRKSVV